MTISLFIKSISEKEEFEWVWQYKLALKVFQKVCSILDLKCLDLFNVFVSQKDMARYNTLEQYLGNSKYNIPKLLGKI